MFQPYFYKSVVFIPVILIVMTALLTAGFFFMSQFFLAFISAVITWLSFKLLDQGIEAEVNGELN